MPHAMVIAARAIGMNSRMPGECSMPTKLSPICHDGGRQTKLSFDLPFIASTGTPNASRRLRNSTSFVATRFLFF